MCAPKIVEERTSVDHSDVTYDKFELNVWALVMFVMAMLLFAVPFVPVIAILMAGAAMFSVPLVVCKWRIWKRLAAAASDVVRIAKK